MSINITTSAGTTVRIRIARDSDAAVFADFYRYYVEQTAINFEYEAPDETEFVRRIHEILPQLPWLVAVADDDTGGNASSTNNERVLGYLFAEPVSTRGAYSWSVKSSIYLSRTARGQGIGSALYRELERILVAQHIVNLYAIVTVTADDDLTDIGESATRLLWDESGLKRTSRTEPSAIDQAADPHLPPTSPRFHHQLGFSVIGREIGSGYKFDTWYDKLLMQKKLGAPSDAVIPTVPFNELSLYHDYL